MAPRHRIHAALAALALAAVLGACRDEQVSSYRVPKEKDPDPFAGAASAAADSSPGGAAADASGNPAAGTAGMPGGDGSMADTAVPTASGSSLVWTAPADWAAKPLSAMRKGSYEVPGPGGASGDLSITAFPGDVGGEVANVNRWRGQVGLQALAPDAASASLQRLTPNGLSIAVLDVSATASAGDHRILGAIIPYGGSTWFFKLSGPAAVVEKAKPAFLGFMRTVRSP